MGGNAKIRRNLLSFYCCLVFIRGDMHNWKKTTLTLKAYDHANPLWLTVSFSSSPYFTSLVTKICTPTGFFFSSDRVNNGEQSTIRVIDHFRVPKTLTFKMRLGSQPFMWKWVLFAWEWKMISISKAEHLPSFWNRDPGKLGNGLYLARLLEVLYKYETEKKTLTSKAFHASSKSPAFSIIL